MKISCFGSKAYLLRQPLGVSIMTWSRSSLGVAVPVVLSFGFFWKGLRVVGSTRDFFFVRVALAMMLLPLDNEIFAKIVRILVMRKSAEWKPARDEFAH